MIKLSTVGIGIPTYKRPQQLQRLLKSLISLESLDCFQLEILIADNEGGCPQVKAHVKATQLLVSSTTNIRVIEVRPQGISYSRNALLKAAFVEGDCRYMAMVDDDETVDSRWLAELLRVQKIFQADCVGGKKKLIFPNGIAVRKWMYDSHVYTYVPSSHEGLCSRLVSTDNLLITREIYERLNQPLFDHEFALTGGGDTEYLQRIHILGARFAFANRAISFEHIPRSRTTWGWAKKRAFRIGIGLSRISLAHKASLSGQLATISRLLLLTVCSSILIVICFPYKNTRKKYQLFLIQQMGKISGYFGIRKYPYATGSTNLPSS